MPNSKAKKPAAKVTKKVKLKVKPVVKAAAKKPAKAAHKPVAKTHAKPASKAHPKPVAKPVAVAKPVKPVALKPVAAPVHVAPKAAAPATPAPKKINFKVGELVVYPAHGVGKISNVEEQEIAGVKLELYIVDFEKEKLRLKVPTNRAEQRACAIWLIALWWNKP